MLPALKTGGHYVLRVVLECSMCHFIHRRHLSFHWSIHLLRSLRLSGIHLVDSGGFNILRAKQVENDNLREAPFSGPWLVLLITPSGVEGYSEDTRGRMLDFASPSLWSLDSVLHSTQPRAEPWNPEMKARRNKKLELVTRWVYPTDGLIKCSSAFLAFDANDP